MNMEQVQWLNQNSYRAYPLRENTTRRTNEDANITLPDSLIVDFILTTAGIAGERIYLAKLTYSGTFVSFDWRNQDGDPVATLAVNLATHTAYQAYEITGMDDYDDARGRVVLGDVSKLPEQLPQGAFTFELATAEMEPCTVRPDIRGVRSMQVEIDGDQSLKIYGHIKLIAGQNITLTYIPESNGIRIDAIQTDGFADDCPCADAYTIPCIKTINGINVEDVQLVGDGTCIEVSTSGNTITFSDKCSEPCCGCPELDFLSKNLDVLTTALSRVESYADTLQSKLTDFIVNVLVTL